MSLAPGTRLGSYEIRALLGVGGMGEVYRARDIRLNRDVALKALPPSFVHDPERVGRFRREAQLLASLNHPHIGAIYGLEEVEGRQFLVLELVEGGTLADRIGRGALPFSESLAIAQQIAEALEAAHDRGIIHRDLKPANIALTPDDRVKVLDFGLAKAAASDASSPDVGDSPTLTIGATQAGVILGTAAYMSPEQAKGRGADQRSDVWAFGCVLYEMLTGKRAFEGEDASDTLAAVLRADPDWSALPDDVSDAIRVLLKRCLLKDRQQRVANLGVARFVMSEATVARMERGSVPPSKVSPPRRTNIVLTGIAGLAVGGFLAGVGAFVVSRRTPPAQLPAPIRLTVDAGRPVTFAERELAISTDGTHIAYRDGAGISVRNLSELESRVITGTAAGRMPFFSPDGRWIGFFTGNEIRKIPITGGVPTTLGSIGAPPRGGVWTTSGDIILALADGAGLRRVSASGGEMTVFAKPDRQTNFVYPSLLANGRALLFTVTSASTTAPTIGLINLATGERRQVIQGGSGAQYADGFVVYAVGSTLHAIPFDQEHFVTSGESTPVVDNVMTFAAATANFAVSHNGTLVYAPSVREAVIPRTLVWVDRQGHETPLAAPPRPYAAARISPDGTRIALDIRDQQNDIWIWDMRREAMTRMTFDPSVDMCPAWTLDSKRIVWASLRATGTPVLFSQSADATGVSERMGSTANPVFPTSVAPNGQIITWENAGPASSQDIMAFDPTTQKSTPLVATPAAELDGEVSPDGRWLAYESNESGRTEIYVRPFPKVDAGRFPISTVGGTRPAWSPKADEIFFIDSSGGLTSVRLEHAENTIVAGRPQQLFSTRYQPGFTTLGIDFRGYDVARDGQRFLMIKEPAESTPQAQRVVVVVNWMTELRARMLTK
jgi:eukaryotic-like serine/threonine-protein kinase